MKDPIYYTGEPGPEHDPGRSKGRPIPYRCLDCGWHGKGIVLRTAHWYATEHRIVPKGDPRYDDPTDRREVA